VLVRVSEKDLRLIKKICEARGMTVSDFVRWAIKVLLARLSYLSEEEKKALEVA